MAKKKRRRITLIEIMIVMFLIALITGVLAYNYQGTLEEGKAFRTREGIRKIEAALTIEIAKDPSIVESLSGDGWYRFVERSPLVNDPDSIRKDGWGGDYQVTVDEYGKVRVTSLKLNEYTQRAGQ